MSDDPRPPRKPRPERIPVPARLEISFRVEVDTVDTHGGVGQAVLRHIQATGTASQSPDGYLGLPGYSGWRVTRNDIITEGGMPADAFDAGPGGLSVKQATYDVGFFLVLGVDAVVREVEELDRKQREEEALQAFRDAEPERCTAVVQDQRIGLRPRRDNPHCRRRATMTLGGRGYCSQHAAERRRLRAGETE